MDERAKDLGDLARLLEGALDDWDERRWNDPLASQEDEDRSAFFLGAELRPLLRGDHRAKLAEFFARMETEAWAAVMAKNGGWYAADPEALTRRRLAAFRNGMDAP